MKKIILVILALSLILLNSCKRCQTCKCYKNGMVYEESECQRSTDHNNSFRMWQNQIIADNDYDRCDCVYD